MMHLLVGRAASVRLRWVMVAACVCSGAYLFTPSAQAAEALVPESYLPADAAAYVRFDGLDGTTKEFAETTFGKLLDTDLKPLADYLYEQLVDTFGAGFLSQQLLSGSRPETLLELQQASEAFPQLLTRLKRQGLVASLEVINVVKPRVQLTLVVPDIKDDADAEIVIGGFRLIALINEAKVSNLDLAGRKVIQFEIDEVNFACWREGDHVVASIGTEPPRHALDVVTGKRPNLANSPLLKRVPQNVGYATCARGIVNVRGVMDMLARVFPPAKLVTDALGLGGLEHAGFCYGFAGPFQRVSLELEMPGERRGLLRLLTSPAAISLADLPALPPDATTVYASRLDLPGLYEDTVAAATSITQLVFPFDPPNIEDSVEGFNRLLGFDLRADLIASLGDRLLLYDSPSQGPFMMGTTLAIEVKDEARLLKALNNLVVAASAAAGESIRVREVMYRGSRLHVIEVQASDFFFQPTFVVDKGWMVVSLFPQPVQGFVLRNDSTAYQAWNPPASMRHALEAAASVKNGKVVAFSATDPRPAINQLSSFLPLLLGVTRQFNDSGSEAFDLTILPPPQAITEIVSPGSSVTLDDGKTVRIEWRSSLPLPAGLAGLDIQSFFVFGLAFRF